MSASTPVTNELPKVLADITAERQHQEQKWGEQNHPDGTGGELRRYFADQYRRICDTAATAGRVTWRLILMEEAAEAYAEDDPAKLREELIQVAAVAVAWIEAIDRRTA